MACWAVATLFFGGDLGRWNDDYFFVQRDYATGGVRSYVKSAASPDEPESGRLMGWRPLHNVFLPTISTVFHERTRWLHVAQAGAHLGNAALLFTLCRALGRSRHASALAGLLMIVCPVGFEVVLWTSAFSTTVASGLLLGGLLAYVRFVKGGPGWLGAVAPAAALLAVCLNEQPAAAFGAMPVVALAVRPRAVTRSWAARAAWPVALAGAALVAYFLSLNMTMPPGFRGTSGSFVGLDSAWEQFVRVNRTFWRQYVGYFLRTGSLVQGWRELAASPMIAAAWAGVIGFAWVAWWRAWSRDRSGEAAEGRMPEGLRHRRGALLAGLAIGVTSMIPLVLLHYVQGRPRMTYVPTMGGLVALAALVDGLRARVGGGTGRRAMVFALTAAVSGVSMLAMIGVQAGFHRRGVLDRVQAAQLRAAIPEPRPGTVFLAVSAEDAVFDTGSPTFDWYFMGPWHRCWGTPNYPKLVYSRPDVAIACCWPGAMVPAGDEDRLVYDGLLWRDLPADPSLGRATYQRTMLEGARVVPVRLDARGNLRVISELRLERPGGEVAVFRSEQAAEAVAAGRTPAEAWTIRGVERVNANR